MIAHPRLFRALLHPHGEVASVLHSVAASEKCSSELCRQDISKPCQTRNACTKNGT